MKYLPAGTFESARETGLASLFTSTSVTFFAAESVPAYTPRVFDVTFNGPARLTWELYGGKTIDEPPR
jgi:hypothetical protein